MAKDRWCQSGRWFTSLNASPPESSVIVGRLSWMSPGFLRYRVSGVQQKGVITNVVLPRSMLAPFLRKKSPSWMVSESFRRLCLPQIPPCAPGQHPRILVLPSPIWRSASHFGAYPALRRENLVCFFFFRAFFLSQKALTFCPVLDIFRSLVWVIQLKPAKSVRVKCMSETELEHISVSISLSTPSACLPGNALAAVQILCWYLKSTEVRAGKQGGCHFGTGDFNISTLLCHFYAAIK